MNLVDLLSFSAGLRCAETKNFEKEIKKNKLYLDCM